MEKQLIDAFDQVTMPEACAKKIEARLQETPAPVSRYQAKPMQESRCSFLVPLAAMLALVLALGLFWKPGESQTLAEPTQTEDPLMEQAQEQKEQLENELEKLEQSYRFRDSGLRITEGENHVEAEVNTGSVTTWLHHADGRLYFVGNGENMDITERISMEEPFTYAYTDEEGIRIHIAVGRLDAEPYVSIQQSVGWAVWYRDMNKAEAGMPYTGWIGGTSSGHWNNAADAEYEWHASARREFDVPWSI